MKSIYEFTKILSILFLLSGIGFIFSQMYILAALGIGGFIIIRFVDSDFVFNTLQLDNPGSFVVTVTFIVLCVYGFFVYQEMQYAPLLTKVKAEDRKTYIEFEYSLANAFSPCLSKHNELFDKIAYGDVPEKEQKDVNRVCFDSSSEIEKVAIPESVSKTIKDILVKNKAEYKKMAINLSSYKYSEKAVQDGLINRVKASAAAVQKNIQKVRQAMNIDNKESEPASVSLKF